MYLTGYFHTEPLLPQFSRAEQNEKLKFKKSFLSKTKLDNCVFVRGQSEIQVVVIKNFVKLNEIMYALGRKYLCVDNMFVYLLLWFSLNKVLVSQLLLVLESFLITDFRWKAGRIHTSYPETGYFFVCPMIHHSVLYFYPPLTNVSHSKINWLASMWQLFYF